MRQAINLTSSGTLLIWTLGTKLSEKWNINPNSYIFIIQENAFQYVVSEMVVILSRAWW